MSVPSEVEAIVVGWVLRARNDLKAAEYLLTLCALSRILAAGLSQSGSGRQFWFPQSAGQPVAPGGTQG